MKKDSVMGRTVKDSKKSCVENFYTAFNFVSYRSKQDI